MFHGKTHYFYGHFQERLQKTMENHHVSWENSLFRLGHFQVRKLLVITRGYKWI